MDVGIEMYDYPRMLVSFMRMDMSFGDESEYQDGVAKAAIPRTADCSSFLLNPYLPSTFLPSFHSVASMFTHFALHCMRYVQEVSRQLAWHQLSLCYD